MLDLARLDQFGIRDFSEVFDADKLQLRAGSYRDSWCFNSVEDCTHHGAFHFGDLPRPFDFWVYLPGTVSGVDSILLEMCQRVLHDLNQLDSRAREPFDEAMADTDFDLDRDVNLEYVLIETYGAELHYSCVRWNNEYGSHFKWLGDDQWEYSDLI